MKNKKSLLLPLFLLLPAVTQCMENNSKLIIRNKTHATQSKKTIQDLISERNKLKKELQEHWQFGVAQKNISLDILAECAYYPLEIFQISSYETTYCPVFCDITKLTSENLSQAKFKGYSTLGAATMTETVTFKEKKESIREFVKRKCRPTHKDKELAFVEKYERCTPSIIAATCSFRYSPLLSAMEIPQDIIASISLLMFEVEESLL